MDEELPHHCDDGLELGLPARHELLAEGPDVGLVASRDESWHEQRGP